MADSMSIWNRKKFFQRLDEVLPYKVKIFPYNFALSSVRFILKVCCGKNIRVWNRNSTRNNTFVFGNSDLDITVVAGPGFNRILFPQVLNLLKKFFIFLGETNFYSEDDLHWVIPRMNIYELQRDPDLYALYKQFVAKDSETVDKFIFLQRMLFTDFKSLIADPLSRQKKWKGYLDIMGIKNSGIIDVQLVDTLMSETLENPRLIHALVKWQRKVVRGEQDFYHVDFGIGFRIIAPHLQLWKEIDPKEISELTDTEKKIMERQIDWEIWGVYTQRHWLRKDLSLRHLRNLMNIYACVKQEDQSSLFKMIEDSFNTHH